MTASPYAPALASIPVREQEAVVGGALTRWWDYGPADAEAVIAVHGYRGDHHGLEPVVAQLPGLRVIMPDLPAFGASGPFEPTWTDGGRHTVAAYADWLIAFVRHVAPTDAAADAPVTVLGHSFGSIVVSAALERGLAADRVILVNPIAAPALAGPKGVLSRIALGYYRVAAAMPQRAADTMLGNRALVRVMSVTMARTRDRALRRWIHAEHGRYFSAYASPASVVEGFEASIGDHVHAHAAAIQAPTLLIGAAEDQITSRRDLHALHEAIPGAQLVVIDGVGHLIHYEKPVEAAQVILAFLERTA